MSIVLEMEISSESRAVNESVTPVVAVQFNMRDIPPPFDPAGQVGLRASVRPSRFQPNRISNARAAS